MEFFNKKEEVLEVILTQKGKELFSQGNFNPAYYSFHDTDITYDNGSDEEQNSIVERIKDTPTLKAPTNLRQTNKKMYEGSLNKSLEYNLKCEVGSKTLGDQYSPAWNVKFVNYPPFQYVGATRENIIDNKKYEVGLISETDADKSNQESIPQLNITTVFQPYSFPEEDIYEFEFEPTDYSFVFTADAPVIYANLVDAARKNMEKTLGYSFSSEQNFIEILQSGLSFDETFNFNKSILDKLLFVEDTFNKISIQIQKNDKLPKPLLFPRFEAYRVPKIYLMKDPEILMTVDEFNAFNADEFNEYELECYKIKDGGKISEKLTVEDTKKYLNIYFDKMADLKTQLNVKDIYGPQQEVDESTC